MSMLFWLLCTKIFLGDTSLATCGCTDVVPSSTDLCVEQIHNGLTSGSWDIYICTQDAGRNINLGAISDHTPSIRVTSDVSGLELDPVRLSSSACDKLILELPGAVFQQKVLSAKNIHFSSETEGVQLETEHVSFPTLSVTLDKMMPLNNDLPNVTIRNCDGLKILDSGEIYVTEVGNQSLREVPKNCGSKELSFDLYRPRINIKGSSERLGLMTVEYGANVIIDVSCLGHAYRFSGGNYQDPLFVNVTGAWTTATTPYELNLVLTDADGYLTISSEADIVLRGTVEVSGDLRIECQTKNVEVLLDKCVLLNQTYLSFSSKNVIGGIKHVIARGTSSLGGFLRLDQIDIEPEALFTLVIANNMTIGSINIKSGSKRTSDFQLDMYVAEGADTSTKFGPINVDYDTYPDPDWEYPLCRCYSYPINYGSDLHQFLERMGSVFEEKFDIPGMELTHQYLDNTSFWEFPCMITHFRLAKGDNTGPIVLIVMTAVVDTGVMIFMLLCWKRLQEYVLA